MQFALQKTQRQKKMMSTMFSTRSFLFRQHVISIGCVLTTDGFIYIKWEIYAYEIARMSSCFCCSLALMEPPSANAACNSRCKTLNLRRSPSSSRLVTCNNTNRNIKCEKIGQKIRREDDGGKPQHWKAFPGTYTASMRAHSFVVVVLLFIDRCGCKKL